MSAEPKRQAPPSSASASTPGTTTSSATTAGKYRLPTDTTLRYASKLAITEDKPVMLDYWGPSLDKKALVGIKNDSEKLLVKSEDEYTSTIQKFYKCGEEFIIITENSIYLVSSEIPSRRIS